MVTKMNLHSGLALIIFLMFVFQVKSDHVEVNFSMPFVMTCHHDELGDVVQWSYDGVVVFDCVAPYRAGECNVTFFTKKNLERVFIFNIDSSKNTSLLTVTDRKEVLRIKNESSTWSCFHGHKTLAYKFKSTIQSPEITQLTQRPNVIPGENQKITLSCFVNTTSTFTATWSSSRRGIMETNKNQTGGVSTIDIVTQCADNIDTFTCSIDNGESYPVFESVNITVKCKTSFLEDEMEKVIRVYDGEDAILSAKHIGNRVPMNIIWRRKYTNEEIELSNYRTRRIDDEPSGMNQLIIYSVQPQDEGDYKLELVDGTTTVHTMFTVIVISRPDTLSSPFFWYIGIAVGAGSMLLIFITVHIILCIYQKKRNKEIGDYLTPNVIPPSPTPCTNITCGGSNIEPNDDPQSFGSRDSGMSQTYENYIENNDENDF